MPGHPNLSIGPVAARAAPRRPTATSTTSSARTSIQTWLEEMLAFDDQVGAEDIVLVERVQKGVRAGGIEHGRLLRESERLIAHFQRLLLDALA